ncbi:MAG TPA: hypothetical protein VIK25_08480 [Gemmatimonadaceae bacterium]
MRMFWLVYAGPRPAHIAESLLSLGAPGYTEWPHAHGAGAHGRMDGTRAWPGEETVITAVVPVERTAQVADGLDALQAQLIAGEHLHYAVLPVERFR